MREKLLRSCIYDFDGTAVDSLPRHHRAIAAVCAKEKIVPPPLETMCSWWFAPYEERFRQMGVTSSSESLWRTYHRVLGPGVFPLFPGFRSVFESLLCRGLPVYLATAASVPDIVLTNLRYYGILRSFRDIFYGNDDKTEFFEEVLAQTRLRPEEVGVVEDMRSGIVDAKKLGLRAIGFDGGYGGREALLLAGAEDIIETHQEIFRFTDSLD